MLSPVLAPPAASNADALPVRGPTPSHRRARGISSRDSACLQCQATHGQQPYPSQSRPAGTDENGHRAILGKAPRIRTCRPGTAMRQVARRAAGNVHLRRHHRVAATTNQRGHGELPASLIGVGLLPLREARPRDCSGRLPYHSHRWAGPARGDTESALYLAAL